jgi:hypothetical protein
VSRSSRSTRRGPQLRRLGAVVGAGAMLATAGAALTPVASFASSHREAPLISGDPRADNTDTYAFVSPDKPDTVTIIANWYPFEEPNGGPNFYPFATNARHNIKIDNDGDGKADVTYRWTFTDHYRDASGQFLYNTGVVDHINSPNLNFFQTYTLTERENGETTTLLRNKLVAPSDVGAASMPDYGQLVDEAIAQGQLPGGGQNYVGQADDPFFLDLRVFDLLYGGDLSEAGQDTLDGYNVDVIALQVPKADLALRHHPVKNPVIGVWSTTDRRATTGKHPWVQVSRLGNPLVNEAVVPLKYKDAFNAIGPYVDHTVTPVVDKVKDPIIPKLVEAIYGIPAPATPRNDLVEIFLTGICKTCGPIEADLNSQLINNGVDAKDFVPAEELRLNMSVAPTAEPNRLGVIGGDFQGFPNGRRLGDDVIDIALQVMEGAATNGIVEPLAGGDGVNANDEPFQATFPYVALPHDAAVNTTSATSVLPPAGGGGGGFTAHRVPVAAAALSAALVAMVMAAVARRRRAVPA